MAKKSVQYVTKQELEFEIKGLHQKLEDEIKSIHQEAISMRKDFKDYKNDINLANDNIFKKMDCMIAKSDARDERDKIQYGKITSLLDIIETSEKFSGYIANVIKIIGYTAGTVTMIIYVVTTINSWGMK